MFDQQCEIVLDPQIELCKRWGINLIEAGEFLEEVGYFPFDNTEEKEVDYFPFDNTEEFDQ